MIILPTAGFNLRSIIHGLGVSFPFHKLRGCCYAKILSKANHFDKDDRGETGNKQKQSDQYCE